MDKRVIVAFVIVLISFGFLNFIFVNYMGIFFSPVAITGNVIANDTGIISIFIQDTLNIYIDSPENITYNFSKGDFYFVGLNVSADFVASNWTYWLYNVRGGEYDTLGPVSFSPNTTIEAVRWENILTVSALSDSAQVASRNVSFFVYVNNSQPLIGNISDPVYACEGEKLSYSFNATDIDEDDLVGSISPTNPFYLSAQGRNNSVSFFNIVSGTLNKGHFLSSRNPYSETVSVLDPWGGNPDSKAFDIEVIEINNPPVLLNNIGAQTVWLTGENSTFYHVVNVSDIEDGLTIDGNLRFNLTWGGNEELFDIGANDGVMNYSPKLADNGSTYSLTACFSDNALSSPHPNISLCLGSGNSLSGCDSFTLTVTDANRAPDILSYYPNASTINAVGTQTLLFNVSVYDADGTIPDIDWYVDGVLSEHNENISSDEFSYAFACGVSGAHSINVVTSDGLLNDSQIWYISVGGVPCPVSSGGGGGGGGGNAEGYCVEEWFCDEWNVCQNVKKSFNSGVLSLEDYSVAREACVQSKEEDERFCGFQVTQCHDLNACDRDKPIVAKPLEKRFCYFTENPSCFDRITNCHDGACEVLADCGGPCGPCPTCSDKKQNQGESGVDCGGPCPFICEPEVPFAMISSILIVVAFILIVIIIWVLLKLYLLWKRKRSFRE